MIFQREGGYGIVCIVKHKELDVVRAMKMINKNKLNKTDENRLIEEIQILQQIDHPHIVRLYEYYNDANYHYLISE